MGVARGGGLGLVMIAAVYAADLRWVPFPPCSAYTFAFGQTDRDLCVPAIVCAEQRTLHCVR